MKRNLLTGALLVINIVVLIWSANYLVSYASQDKVAAIPFGIIFSAALVCITLVALKWMKDS